MVVRSVFSFRGKPAKAYLDAVDARLELNYFVAPSPSATTVRPTFVLTTVAVSCAGNHRTVYPRDVSGDR